LFGAGSSSVEASSFLKEAVVEEGEVRHQLLLLALRGEEEEEEEENQNQEEEEEVGVAAALAANSRNLEALKVVALHQQVEADEN